MLRQKRALYSCKIVKDGFCVSQNAIKYMDVRITTYLEKKERESDQVPLQLQ